MSEIKNVGQTWIPLNTFKCIYLTPLHFKRSTKSRAFNLIRQGAPLQPWRLKSSSLGLGAPLVDCSFAVIRRLWIRQQKRQSTWLRKSSNASRKPLDYEALHGRWSPYDCWPLLRLNAARTARSSWSAGWRVSHKDDSIRVTPVRHDCRRRWCLLDLSAMNSGVRNSGQLTACEHPPATHTRARAYRHSQVMMSISG